MAIERWLQRVWWQRQLPPSAWPLAPVSGLYRTLQATHQWLYAHGWRHAHTAPVPVVVVGNVIVGGAGKTPTTLALVQGLQARGWRPGIVSRGYGGRRREAGPVTPDTDPALCGDEPLLLRRRAQVPVWTGRQRIEAARGLCQAHPEINILVADDGLQHLALTRTASVIVFDERGLGNGWCLPAGPLRQGLASQPPPRSLVLFNAATPSMDWPGHCAQRGLGPILPLKDWWAERPAAACAVPLAQLRHQRLRAAAGIASPERFFTLLESAGLRIERWPLPDHAVLSPRPWPDDGTPVIVTEKDAVKLPADSPDAGRILVAPLDFQLPDAVWQALMAWLPTAPPNPHETPWTTA